MSGAPLSRRPGAGIPYPDHAVRQAARRGRRGVNTEAVLGGTPLSISPMGRRPVIALTAAGAVLDAAAAAWPYLSYGSLVTVSP